MVRIGAWRVINLCCFRYITLWSSRYGQDTAGQGCCYRMFIEFSQVRVIVLNTEYMPTAICEACCQLKCPANHRPPVTAALLEDTIFTFCLLSLIIGKLDQQCTAFSVNFGVTGWVSWVSSHSQFWCQCACADVCYYSLTSSILSLQTEIIVERDCWWSYGQVAFVSLFWTF